MRKRAFHHLWIGDILANFGGVFYVIFLICMVTKQPNAGFTLLMTSLCIVVFRFLATLLKKNESRNFVNILLLLRIFFISLLLIISDSPYFYIIIALIAVMDGICTKSKTLLPIIYRREESLHTNGFLSIIDQAAYPLSWIVGGALAIEFDPSLLLYISTICSLIAVLFRFSIPKSVEKNKHNRNELVVEAFKRPSLTGQQKKLFFLLAIEILASSVLMAATLFLLSQSLFHDNDWWIVMNSGFFVGILIGSLLLMKWKVIFYLDEKFVLFLSAVFSALVTYLLTNAYEPALAVTCLVVLGIFTQLRLVIQTALLQEQRYHPILISGFYTVMTAGSLLLIAFILPIIGIPRIFFISSCLLIIYAILINFYKKVDSP